MGVPKWPVRSIKAIQSPTNNWSPEADGGSSWVQWGASIVGPIIAMDWCISWDTGFLEEASNSWAREQVIYHWCHFLKWAWWGFLKERKRLPGSGVMTCSWVSTWCLYVPHQHDYFKFETTLPRDSVRTCVCMCVYVREVRVGGLCIWFGKR